MRRGQPRYKFTLDHHGLNDYDYKAVEYVFSSSSPKDAIRRVNKIIDQAEREHRRISYYAKQFLEGVAMSAHADLSD